MGTRRPPAGGPRRLRDADADRRSDPPAPVARRRPRRRPPPPRAGADAHPSAGVVRIQRGLVGAGDIASCGLTADTATAKLVAGIAGTVFTAGDNAYESGSAAEYRDCYDPTWGPFRDRTYPVPGNHEYVTAGAAGLLRLLRRPRRTDRHRLVRLQPRQLADLRAQRELLGGRLRAWGQSRSSGCGPTWRASPRACVLAYWHQPRFSSGEHGNDSSVAAFWDDLYAAGAEVVINGHDHDYERFAPRHRAARPTRQSASVSSWSAPAAPRCGASRPSGPTARFETA